jgi:hypothetical protein
MMALSRSVLFAGVGVLGMLGSLQAGRRPAGQTSDFAFLQPWFEVQRDDRQKLVQRGIVVRGLPADNEEIGILAVCAVRISPDVFVERIRTPGGLSGTEGVGGRFDDPPVLENLARLSLDEGDVDRLRRCRPGDCRLNLADQEIAAVQQAFAKNPGGGSAEVNQVFRRVVLDRVRRYKSGGLEALPAYHDRSEPVRPAAVFSEIIRQTPYLKTQVPRVAAYLEGVPSVTSEGAESFLRWSRVMMNEKAVVMASHVSIFRPEPGPNTPTVLVASKQVYASRYMNGELSLTMLFAGAAGSSPYLVHVHRSQLDELKGTLSGLKRTLIERRVKEEAAEGLAALRNRLEHAP